MGFAMRGTHWELSWLSHTAAIFVFDVRYRRALYLRDSEDFPNIKPMKDLIQQFSS